MRRALWYRILVTWLTSLIDAVTGAELLGGFPAVFESMCSSGRAPHARAAEASSSQTRLAKRPLETNAKARTTRPFKSDSDCEKAAHPAAPFQRRS